MKLALLAGHEILKNQGTSLEAVIEAISILEDCPLFNAGKGSVYSNIGTIECDASLMEGR